MTSTSFRSFIDDIIIRTPSDSIYKRLSAIATCRRPLHVARNVSLSFFPEKHDLRIGSHFLNYSPDSKDGMCFRSTDDNMIAFIYYDDKVNGTAIQIYAHIYYNSKLWKPYGSDNRRIIIRLPKVQTSYI